ncbi:hypothetical protein BJY52DRAFT_1229059 [Lactarius psammicola]|nr:hypothetical protein BJY52DRAFT_1229059 [Lactarius psammicola]
MAQRTCNSQRLMRNQTPGALGETYASLDLSSHADTMNTTSGVAGQGVNVQRSDNPTPPQTNLIGNRKCTTSSHNNGPEDIPTNAATGQPIPVKRPRNVGPACSRPLQLELASESEIRQSQSDGVACVSRGGQQTVQPASSHAIVLNPEPTSLPNDDESYGESEEWSSEEDMANLTPGQPGRFNEAIVNERPIWKGLATTTGPTTSVHRTSSAQGLTSHDDVSPWSNAVLCWSLKYPPWPQHHLDRTWGTVIQDAIEILQASLMFDNVFPDSIHTLTFVRRSLLTSAQKRCPTALSIHTRLVQDEDYISKIIPVGKGGGNAPVRHLQPYRNKWIIHVIRDLYFTEGNSSFSTRFSHLFPGSYSNMGYVMEYEVPVPMVTLVAMAAGPGEPGLALGLDERLAVAAH